MSVSSLLMKTWVPGNERPADIVIDHAVDILIIVYSPVGREFLTGEIRSQEDVPTKEWQQHLAQFQSVASERNLNLAEAQGRWGVWRRARA